MQRLCRCRLDDSIYTDRSAGGIDHSVRDAGHIVDGCRPVWGDRICREPAGSAEIGIRAWRSAQRRPTNVVGLVYAGGWEYSPLGVVGGPDVYGIQRHPSYSIAAIRDAGIDPLILDVYHPGALSGVTPRRSDSRDARRADSAAGCIAARVVNSRHFQFCTSGRSTPCCVLTHKAGGDRSACMLPRKTLLHMRCRRPSATGACPVGTRSPILRRLPKVKNRSRSNVLPARVMSNGRLLWCRSPCNRGRGGCCDSRAGTSGGGLATGSHGTRK